MTSFDPKHAKLAASCEHSGTLFALCHDASTNRLYGAGTDWAVYSVESNAEKPTVEKRWANHENYVSSLVFVDGVVISAGFDRQMIWTNAETGESIRKVEAHDGWVRNLALFPDGKRLASVGDDMLVKIWDAQSGELIRTLEGHAKQTPQGFATALYAVAVSPNGAHVTSGDRIGDVRVWDAESGEIVAEFQAPTFYTYDPVKRSRSIGGIRSVCFSPDGTGIAISGIGRVTNVDGFVGPCRVEVWDWQSGKRVFVGQDKHNAVLNHFAYHPTEPKWLVAAGGGDGGGAIVFWDQISEKAAHVAKPKGHLHRFCFDATGTRLYAAGFEGFQIWHLDASDDQPLNNAETKS